MNKNNIHSILENYINDLNYALREPILQREIGDFPIDEMKAFFLLLPVVNERMQDDRIKGITLSLGAIHAALDIHDLIDIDKAVSAQQQLTVLAGDHFSGIHYRVLAENGEFVFIRELSRTIAHINEQKTTLHQVKSESAAGLIAKLKVIECGCISTFYSEFGFEGYLNLTETALTYLRLKKMLNASKPQFTNVEPSTLKKALEMIEADLTKELQLMNFLNSELQQIIHELVNPLKSLS